MRDVRSPHYAPAGLVPIEGKLILGGRRDHRTVAAVGLGVVQRFVRLVQHDLQGGIFQLQIGIGEIACAIIAERQSGGVLCDDRKARRWLADRVAVLKWESIEDILLDARPRSQEVS